MGNTHLGYYTVLARLRRGWSVHKTINTPLRHKGGGKTTHGKTGSKEYVAWKAMLGRCFYTGYHAYHRYGGRGISVCERWRTSFEAFLADVGPAPSSSMSLGRLDNDGNYEPGNCCWQTAKQQAANRSTPTRNDRGQ